MDTQARTFRVIGRRTPKVDAIDKVTGPAQFGADVAMARILVGKALRSPYAHARIKRIDTSQAKTLPGVKAVITGADHPYGIRAVGQVPIVPPATAIANAIYHATGVRPRELPMTPERLHWALKHAQETPH